MASILTYETNQVVINDSLFPANSISFQVGATTVPVKDILGNILYYSPTEPVRGSFTLNFFLTGALPSYLRLENQSETPTKVEFNKIVIPDCYLTNLSFAVRPFEPIPVKADFVFYHGIRSLNTDPTIINSFQTSLVSPNIAYSNQSFNSGLNTLNGMSSYIITEDRSTYTENPTDFVVSDFDYQFSVERVPVLRAGEKYPLRVAMKDINAEFNITATNLDGVLDIKGNSAVFSATLRDNTNLNVSDTLNLTGIIVDQSYEISEDNYGYSKIKMIQSLNRKRNLITIPMEVSDPLIVNSPTTDNRTITIPGTSVVTKKIVDNSTSITPPNTPTIEGATNTPQNPPIDDTEWYYVSVVVNVTMINAQNAGCNSVKLFSITTPSNINFAGMKLELINGTFDKQFSETEKAQTNTGAPINKEFNYNANCTILTLKVNKTFLDDFYNSSYRSTNLNSEFITFKCLPCNNSKVLEKESQEIYSTLGNTQKLGDFFNSNFFNALNDTYKNKNTPYIHDITIVGYYTYGLFINY